jgi:hypothetical protein
MVRHREPRPLYSLCHRQFVEYLGEKVVKAGYDSSQGHVVLSTVRLKWRPFFLEHIPVAVRTSLIHETSEFLFNKSQVM